MRIGIIGTGISGNVASRLLSQSHDIEVFEAGSTIGGHARTVEVAAFGRTWPVDTGFMVYNERTYPNFCRLLQLLDLVGQDGDMSFSVRCEPSGLEYQGSSLNGLFAQRRNLLRPAFWRMLKDILSFNEQSRTLLKQSLGDKTLGSLLAGKGIGSWFVSKYLLPMTAAIWSCPPEQILKFPAHFLLTFLNNHGLLQLRDRPQWKTIPGGSRRYVERLTEPFRDRIRTDCPVESVSRHEDHVVVRPRNAAPEIFDCVVLACHADEALSLLTDADDDERTMLAALPYQSNLAVLHTDISVLPQRRRAWASWNYRIPAQGSHPVAVTYDLSRLQNLATPSPLLLTLNAVDDIESSKVLNRHVFRHPVYTPRSLAAQIRLRKRNGRRRTFFCGAYCGHGFHEDGVNSALEVVRHFDLSMNSWKAASTKVSFATNDTSR